MAGSSRNQDDNGKAMIHCSRYDALSIADIETSHHEMPAYLPSTSNSAHRRSVRSPDREISPLSDADAIAALARLGTPTPVRQRPQDDSQLQHGQVPGDVEEAHIGWLDAGMSEYTSPAVHSSANHIVLSEDEEDDATSDVDVAEALARLGTPTPSTLPMKRNSRALPGQNTARPDAGIPFYLPSTRGPSVNRNATYQDQESSSTREQKALQDHQRSQTSTLNHTQLPASGTANENASHAQEAGSSGQASSSPEHEGTGSHNSMGRRDSPPVD